MKGLFHTTRRPTGHNPVMLLLVLYLAQFSAVTAKMKRKESHLIENSRNIYREIINMDYVRSIVTARSDGLHLVQLTYSLFSLDEVNEKEQKMVTSGRLYLGWKDERLTWRRKQFGNITSLFVDQQDIWLPDIIVANRVTKDIQLGVTKDIQFGFDELPCRVSHNGIVDWRPATRLATSCSIDVTYFPFDVQVSMRNMSPSLLMYRFRILCPQVCDIAFETLITTTEEVVINLHESLQLPDKPRSFGVVFTLYLERRTKFYILAIGMPVFLISLTGTLVFALPSPSGEKMGLGMTVLLAYAVHLAVVFEKLPNTSVQCLSTRPARLESYDIARNAISPARKEMRPNSRDFLKDALDVDTSTPGKRGKSLHGNRFEKPLQQEMT
ncbi:hypothetical protein RRG08_039684 [Elysia crispata]|uniref:Neurotransmitter-gated ion-channel ligand-binding domain-containing protein n=1 Tax=Elysia crispata TaxID=231223 RepID=A0AAE0YB19_9GAST|nr:hypothetical protein RRG08_039684 [Elysia crispata]